MFLGSRVWRSLESTAVIRRLDAVSLAGCIPKEDIFGGSRSQTHSAEAQHSSASHFQGAAFPDLPGM